MAGDTILTRWGTVYEWEVLCRGVKKAGDWDVLSSATGFSKNTLREARNGSRPATKRMIDAVLTYLKQESKAE